MGTQENGKQVVGTEEARQGKEMGSVRYVLAISLSLAVIAGVVVYFVH